LYIADAQQRNGGKIGIDENAPPSRPKNRKKKINKEQIFFEVIFNLPVESIGKVTD
jgi:hypothetical protein